MSLYYTPVFLGSGRKVVCHLSEMLLPFLFSSEITQWFSEHGRAGAGQDWEVVASGMCRRLEWRDFRQCLPAVGVGVSDKYSSSFVTCLQICWMYIGMFLLVFLAYSPKKWQMDLSLSSGVLGVPTNLNVWQTLSWWQSVQDWWLWTWQAGHEDTFWRTLVECCGCITLLSLYAIIYIFTFIRRDQEQSWGQQQPCLLCFCHAAAPSK